MTITPMGSGPSAVPSTAAAIYTSPANTKTVLTRASVVNVTAAAVTLTLWLVRSGGATGAGTIIKGASAGGESIAAGPSAPQIINELAGLVLLAGDAIWGEASAASSLNMTFSGWTQ